MNRSTLSTAADARANVAKALVIRQQGRWSCRCPGRRRPSAPPACRAGPSSASHGQPEVQTPERSATDWPSERSSASKGWTAANLFSARCLVRVSQLLKFGRMD
jgi:hypothetical protein